MMTEVYEEARNQSNRFITNIQDVNVVVDCLRVLSFLKMILFLTVEVGRRSSGCDNSLSAGSCLQRSSVAEI